MTKLLTQYYETKEYFRTEEVRNRYKTINEWSVALNSALADILCVMEKTELIYLLDHTSGMFRSVIAEYLDRLNNPAQEKNKNKKPNEKKGKNAADNEIAATLTPAVKRV